MRNNKTFYVIIVLLLAIIVGGAIFLVLNSRPGTEPEVGNQQVFTPPPPIISPKPLELPEPEPEEILSEQPNKEKFNEYFTEIFLSKLPAGAKFDPLNVIKTKIFTPGDQLCVGMTIKKKISVNQLASAVYDINAKQDIQPKITFPQELKQGGAVGCVELAQPIGKYEYKIYIDDALVAVLSFEVK